MSRFFRGGNDSSSESSSDEEDLYESEEEEQEEQQEESEEEEDEDEDEEGSDAESSDSDAGKAKGASRFLEGWSESEESDTEQTTKVKSAKDKRHDELEATITAITNAQKINDWNIISTEFDKLNRQAEKLKVAGKAPKPYVKCIAELEEYMNEAIAKQKVTPAKKGMSKQNAQGLNAVKQKIKKTNKEYQSQIEEYKEDKDGYLWESEEEEPAPKPKKVRLADAIAASTDDVDDEGFATVGKGGKTLVFTPESILKHLRTIMESRGKKNTDKVEQIKIMEKLNEIANTPYQRIRVLLTLISTRFDLGSGATTSMPLEHWKAAEKEIGQLLTTLNENRDYVVIENAEEWEDDEKPPTLEKGQKYIKVPGSIVSYVERLDDEMTRSLQNIDPHTSEYIERLTDAAALYNLIFRALLYYEQLQKDEALAIEQDNINRIVSRRLEHVYFKPAQVVKTLEENSWKSVGADVDSAISPRAKTVEAVDLVNILSNYLFANSEGIHRARAMLCQIYFLALHDDYYKARDMMLMSHLQETISSFNVSTQILFNRTLVQVGLCAFRKGLVYDAQNTLQEICGSGRQKELLAQGVMIQRYSQVTPEQERLERQRQLPFHLHINLELLECVYLTCSMLLEIPLLAQIGSSPDVKKRVISKTYRRMLEYHERQIFTGPPENTRDHVMQASKALAAGEWKKATEFIHAIKIWELMPDTDGIKEMLAKQIQEEGLRTYLFTYAPFYDTLAVETLSGMFELDATKTAAIVSKMISHEELAAALDQVTKTVIFRKGVELSRLQSLALALSDKASALMESNERTLEHRTQGTANAFERTTRHGGRGGRGGRGGGGRGRGGARSDGAPRQSQGFTGGALGVRG